MRPLSKADLAIRPGRTSRWLLVKESVFLALAGTVAGLCIYIANDEHSSFGLVHQVALAQRIPTITNFRTEVLVSEPFLDLNLYPQPKPETQVDALLFNPKVPPKVEALEAYNSRIGEEVVLFWTAPEGVSLVNIYRQVAGADPKTEIQIATRHEGEFFIDYEVEDKIRYQYRVASVSVVDEVEYEAAEPVVTLVSPADIVPPRIPTEVLVTPVVATDEPGLLVIWQNPKDEDLARLRIYRSSVFGNRGLEVGVVEIGEPNEFLDTTAEPNTRYYYTVVAEDTSGNTSSDDFQLPAAGNTQPFEPFSIEEVLEGRE